MKAGQNVTIKRLVEHIICNLSHLGSALIQLSRVSYKDLLTSQHLLCAAHSIAFGQIACFTHLKGL